MRAIHALLSLAIIATAPLPAAADTAAITEEARECMAKAIYFEARGEEEAGQRAIANVILNRVEHPDFPDTVCEVVKQGGEKPPCQFSWWCDGKSDDPKELEAWQGVRTVVEEVAEAPEKDITDGAVYFHATSVDPSWRTAMEPVGEIGNHVYYRPGDEPEGQR